MAQKRREHVGEGKGVRRNSFELPEEGANSCRRANEESEGSCNQTYHLSESEPLVGLCIG